jgi:hypothetical protein
MGSRSVVSTDIDVPLEPRFIGRNINKINHKMANPTILHSDRTGSVIDSVIPLKGSVLSVGRPKRINPIAATKLITHRNMINPIVQTYLPIRDRYLEVSIIE